MLNSLMNRSNGNRLTIKNLTQTVQSLQNRLDDLSHCIGGLKLFALNAANKFGEEVSDFLGEPLSKLEEDRFPDGEAKIKSLENVRNAHAVIMQHTYEDDKESVDGKLMKLLFLTRGIKQAGAGHITVVLPYFPYSRQDRKVNPREVVATQAIAQLIEGAGATGVLTMDIHNLGAFQNAFRIRNDNLEAKNLFATYLVNNDLKEVNPPKITILCPDAGGMGRANRLRKSIAAILNVDQETIKIAHLDKIRVDGEVVASRIVGVVKNQFVVAIDDMIGSGRTIKEAIVTACKEGAAKAIAVATHGIFIGANEHLEIPEISKLIITDTIKPFRLSEKVLEKIHIISTTGLFAEAIRRMYTGESLSSLLNNVEETKSCCNLNNF